MIFSKRYASLRRENCDCAGADQRELHDLQIGDDGNKYREADSDPSKAGKFGHVTDFTYTWLLKK